MPRGLIDAQPVVLDAQLAIMNANYALADNAPVMHAIEDVAGAGYDVDAIDVGELPALEDVIP